MSIKTKNETVRHPEKVTDCFNTNTRRSGESILPFLPVKIKEESFIMAKATQILCTPVECAKRRKELRTRLAEMLEQCSDYELRIIFSFTSAYLRKESDEKAGVF